MSGVWFTADWDKRKESSSLSCLDVVALDLGVRAHTDHKHVIVGRETDIRGSTCRRVGRQAGRQASGTHYGSKLTHSLTHSTWTE